MKYFESILQIIPSVHSSATLLSCPSSSPRLSSLLALHSSPSPSNPKGPSFPSSISASTLFAASSLRRALEEASTIGVDLIHVDLSDITWINGSALRHVANTRRRMADLLDVDLDLVEWSAAVSRMSSRTRLDGALGRVA